MDFVVRLRATASTTGGGVGWREDDTLTLSSNQVVQLIPLIENESNDQSVEVCNTTSGSTQRIRQISSTMPQ